MLAALVKHDAGGAVLGVLSDPSAAEAAHEAGENSQLVIELGGKGGIPEDYPFKGTFTVAIMMVKFIAPAPIKEAGL